MLACASSCSVSLCVHARHIIQPFQQTSFALQSGEQTRTLPGFPPGLDPGTPHLLQPAAADRVPDGAGPR